MCRRRSRGLERGISMSEIAKLEETQSWSPAPDEGQAGTVLTSDGQWAYRYKDGAELIMMKMPDRPAST